MILPQWCNINVKILKKGSPKRPIFTVILRNQKDHKILPEEPTGTIIMSDTVDWFGQKQGGAHLIEAGIGGEHVQQ